MGLLVILDITGILVNDIQSKKTPLNEMSGMSARHEKKWFAVRELELLIL